MVKSILENMFHISSTDLVISLFFILGFVLIAISILQYVFYSLAFYRFMKSRNLKKAFFAWIPFASYYAVGKVYDDINEKQGIQTNFSLIMNTLAGCVLGVIIIPISPIISKFFIILILISPLISMELSCYKLIFKEYAPNNSHYILLTRLFLFIPIIPSFYLLKVSRNQPISEVKC